ncbi:MAG: superoxide dismutase [Verrucomicrobia bacterium]|nr:superoxide dismutase [Verrucomicrobiota bacterium]
MRILAIERELPLPMHRNLQDLLREEAAVVWELQKRSIIREIWFTKADRRAVIMLECADVAEARKHLATLPLVRAELIDFALHELCTYDGLERLLATNAPAANKSEEPPEY